MAEASNTVPDGFQVGSSDGLALIEAVEVTQADVAASNSARVDMLIGGFNGDKGAWRKVEQAFARHRMAAAVAASCWQPIATAPKDREFITLSDNGHVDVGGWCDKDQDWYKYGCGWQWVTHWMPLPDMPAPAAQAAQ